MSSTILLNLLMSQLACTGEENQPDDTTPSTNDTGTKPTDTDSDGDTVPDDQDDCPDDATGYQNLDYFLDDDSDQWGGSDFINLCGIPGEVPSAYQGEYVIATGDCDDADPATNPDQYEVCDGLDNDCDGVVDNEAQGQTSWYYDGDGDGYGNVSIKQDACTAAQAGSELFVNNSEDCNDSDAAINPGEAETCDDIDNNCNDTVDEDLPLSTLYADEDSDGYGDEDVAISTCNTSVSGYVDDTSDCDDADATSFPGATETADDGVDQDCDGSDYTVPATDTAEPADTSTPVDTGDGSEPTDTGEPAETCTPQTFYYDSDGDGFGDSAVAESACTASAGFVATSDDCDDTDASLNPNTAWYVDADGDSHGDAAATTVSQCVQPAGYVAAADADDCDDTSATTYPGATELYDSVDNDCDGTVDDSITTANWYDDDDGDGYGASSSTITVSDRDLSTSGYALTNTDCDDTSAGISPAATEECDGTDNDCDGDTDDDDNNLDLSTATTWYYDGDSDTYGISSIFAEACEAPASYVADATDFNDESSAAYPGATEVCDEIDNDGDSVTDEGVTTTYYRDGDADGYGTSATSTAACSAPSGYTTDATDCNDGSASISPAATEICDAANTDEDCDGTADNADASATGKTTRYYDGDSDGYGSTTSESVCDHNTGYTATTSTDCDDTVTATNPGATETCNGVDDDCDGTAEDGLTFTSYYTDSDSDGYGDPSAGESSCETSLSGSVTNDDDCDDTSAAISPAATEICDSADTDEDCDGTADDADSAASGKSTVYVDSDGDGYGSTTTASYCNIPATGYATSSTDCSDTSASVYPGATETCNSTDDDCDGSTDEGVTTTYFADDDGDGYGDAASSVAACSASTGYVADATDCDDSSSSVSPGATEDDTNFEDDDCDGTAEISASAANDFFDGFADEQVGYSIDGVGDVTGDGIDDVIIGAPYSSESGDSQSGTAYLLAGTGTDDDPIDETAPVYIYGYDNDQKTGSAVSGAGDFNGDGYGDFVVGSRANDDVAANAGLVSVFFGNGALPSNTTSNAADVLFWGAQAGGGLGYRLAGGEDVGGDGYDDLLTGAPSTDVLATSDDAGTAYLFSGTSSGSWGLASATAAIQGDSTNEGMGYDVALADLDSDGIADVVVAAAEGASTKGEVFIYQGPVSGTLSPTSADVTYTGAALGDGVDSIAANSEGGDINGDGENDLVVCASEYDHSSTITDSGACYIIYGPHASATLSSSLGSMVYGASTDDLLGSGDVDIGDLDGDGLGDVVMGAMDNASVHILLGNWLPSGSYSANEVSHRLYRESTGYEFGCATSFIGDLDSDGYEDMAIGDDLNTPASYTEGGTAYFYTDLQ